MKKKKKKKKNLNKITMFYYILNSIERRIFPFLFVFLIIIIVN